jgi:hypothetical protein
VRSLIETRRPGGAWNPQPAGGLSVEAALARIFFLEKPSALAYIFYG